jgi:hypothetical protein
MKILTKTGDTTTKISFDNQDDILLLDFQPIISHYNLSGNFCLLHWQARPKGLRGFGVYDSSSLSYYDVNHNKLDILANNCRTLQIDENVHKTNPVAVLLYEKSRLHRSETGSYAILPEGKRI